MNPTCNWKTVLIGGVCATILSGLAVKIKQFVNAEKQTETIKELVLLYGTGEDIKKKQVGLNNLFCVNYALINASRSIDVCMPSLNSDIITKCLLNVHHKNNILVRIVVHKNENLDLKLKPFLDSSIDVKVINKTEVEIQHEFMLIDAVADCDEALAIIGSLDYDVKQVNCDKDSTLLTAEKSVVCTLKREFERIWKSAA